MDIKLIAGQSLLTLLTFILLLYIIYRFAWTPFNETIKARQDKIAQDWQEAEQAKSFNQEAQNQIDDLLRAAHQEAEQITRQAQIDAKQNREAIIATARKEQAQLLESTQAEMKIQRQQFAQEMQESLIHIASAMAGKILKRQVTPQDHQQMVEEFIQRLGDLDEQE